MTAKITNEVLEGYLNCGYKGHLKLVGEHGTQSDYEALMAQQRGEVRLQSIDTILARYGEDQVARYVPLTTAALKQGPLFVLDAVLENEIVSLHLDGLKRVDGPSKLGDYHYVPMVFHGGRSVRSEQRLLLELCGLLLSHIQGRMPGYGIVWYGKDCRAMKVRLNPNSRKAERLLREVQQMREAESPRLVLNDHCQVCEFRQRCHEQAVREDNLSLLRGVGEKEVRRYARKGILTLTQLAHTFRPRRKGKRVVRRGSRRYQALQALAIRDKRIYLFGTPELPDAPARIYLDVEGLPDEGFVYLIGMTVVRGGSEEHHSFWADTKDQEPEIFEQFLAQVSRYDNFRVYCYGGYERTFLKRLRKAASRKKPVDRVLAALVNVLSLVYSHVYFPCYSNGLKEVASCLGYSWTDPDASGVQSIAWRKRWEAGHAEEWRGKLVTYNREDCIALRKVTELISAFAFQPAEARAPRLVGWCDIPVASVEELDRLGVVERRGKIGCSRPGIKDFRSKRDFLVTAWAELGGGILSKQGSFPGIRCSEHHNQERKPHGAVYDTARSGGKWDGSGRTVGAAAHAGRGPFAAVRGEPTDARGGLHPGEGVADRLRRGGSLPVGAGVRPLRTRYQGPGGVAGALPQADLPDVSSGLA